MGKYRESITCEQDLNDMDELIWNNACRFNINEFCHSGGFTPDALLEFIELAREGFQKREKE